jgi:hypothetical protein
MGAYSMDLRTRVLARGRRSFQAYEKTGGDPSTYLTSRSRQTCARRQSQLDKRRCSRGSTASRNHLTFGDAPDRPNG